MRNIFRCVFLASVLLPCYCFAWSPRPDLAAWWQFDAQQGNLAIDTIGPTEDLISGNFEYVQGVSGKAVRLDGDTTFITRKAEKAPQLRDAFTIEAWVALQALPWNWTAIVTRLNEQKAGWFFGIDAEGHPGVKLNLDGKLHECVAAQSLPLLKWSHVAATFDRDKGIALYIDGKQVHAAATTGSLGTDGLADLLIGRSHEKMYPVGTERGPSKKLLSNMVLDGLLDEVKIYNSALPADQIGASFSKSRPANPQPLNWPKLPSGPKDLPKRFGAFYTRLSYTDQWEKPWRVGPKPDILVTFDLSPVRVAFWRGTNYGASWITENDICMGDQSLEDGGTGWGCCEHMSDKQCRYSHVRLIEDTEARIVVHWRYAVCDIRYTINHENPTTGWGDWADEYYYIYPDAVAVRKQILHSDKPGGFQWQETIIFNQPGTRPEDNVELEALTLANLAGEKHTYSWADGAPKSFDRPKDPSIQMTNLKAKHRPFIIFEPTSRITTFGGGGGLSKFPWWNHWPVAQLPNDGRVVCGPDRPSSSSLSNSKPKPVPGRGCSHTALSLYGMTDEPVDSVLPLAKSWNNPAPLKLACAGFESKGYDKSQRAYVLTAKDSDKPSALEFELAAGEDSPLVNPAFVIENWPDSRPAIRINGKSIRPSSDRRVGWVRTLEGTHLIVWLKLESAEPVRISLSPSQR